MHIAYKNNNNVNTVNPCTCCNYSKGCSCISVNDPATSVCVYMLCVYFVYTYAYCLHFGLDGKLSLFLVMYFSMTV